MVKRRPENAREDLELNPERRRAWLAYMRVNLQLTYEMNHQLVAGSGLSLSDYHVLNKLHQAPRRSLRIAALAREIGWERSRASHQVRRMTERGLISTGPVKNDKRGTEVTVTERGSAAFLAARPGHVALVEDLVFRGLRNDLVAPLTEALEQIYANVVERGSADLQADA